VTDLQGQVLYANETLAKWLGHEGTADLIGQDIAVILSKASHLYYQTQISPMLRLQGAAQEISLSLQVKGQAADLPVLMNAAHRAPEGEQPGRLDHAFFQATDRLRFERQLRQSRAEAEELAAIVRSASVGILRCDANGRIKRMNAAALPILGVGAEGLPSETVSALLKLETEEEDWYQASVQKIATTRRAERFEAAMNGAHYNISVTSIENPAEPFAAPEYSVIVRDITERVMATRRVELLVGELNHRIKNVFTITIGLVRRTLRGAPEDRDKLIQRLRNLAASHDVLTANYWGAADIRRLVEPIQAQATEGQEVLAEGPEVLLAPTQFKALSMALHELSTNARKYGALSVDAGKIEIRWSFEVSSERLTLLWRETGGPPVRPPEKSGFGTLMIDQVLSAEFDGRAELLYEPQGLEFRFSGTVTTPQGA
jgi:PAS domain S-box-containing protein